MTDALAVDHVTDYNRRYPGETVTFFTRVEAREPLPGFTLRVEIPEGMATGGYAASANHGGALPEFVHVGDVRYMIWKVERPVEAGERFEYRLEGALAQADRDLMVESTALATSRAADGVRLAAQAAVSVAVAAQGRYGQYLPALYQEEDELLGRFLMLFESFWAPVTGRIEQMPYYFDARTAPADLLPWLATWVDLALDERWPEAKRRRLLRSAVALYRKRGTKDGLQEYLEIYAGKKPSIIEHGAHNFRLGREARLGPAVALGTVNQPHTFTVTLRLPPVSEADGAAASARREQERRRIAEAIIEAEKPAHTAYRLTIESETEETEEVMA